MAKPLLSLCSQSKIATRDGWVGRTAHFFLPFYEFGYWFASGQQYTFPSGTIPQDQSITMSGTHKPNTFIKAQGVCISGS